ncbi:hypothetical protein [Ruegeria sp. Ofav3-42]|uniref:hypothetical protein n=1 Tax=Ruegeria sp. Ofav3-42 TaxID=2917759 RepID=UPI001EF4221B|nr:hypothetical protein [Ruegeria sp. Ofav3-42]MCG7521937.1 hypothetical protein [Ruegeria sp. Ofav3-42]
MNNRVRVLVALLAVLVVPGVFVLWEMSGWFTDDIPEFPPAIEGHVMYYDLTTRVIFGTPSGPVVAQTTDLIRHEVGPSNDGSIYAKSGAVEGEADVVEFENGEHAILLPGSIRHGLLYALRTRGRRVENDSDGRVSIAMFGRADDTIVLNELEYPKIVTFKDLVDPITVQRVTPETIEDLIGPGYSIERVEIEPGRGRNRYTDEIESLLPWLSEWPKNLALDGAVYRDSDALNQTANSLRIFSFIRKQ